MLNVNAKARKSLRTVSIVVLLAMLARTCVANPIIPAADQAAPVLLKNGVTKGISDTDDDDDDDYGERHIGVVSPGDPLPDN